jgi:putative hydrolase of the HAD superfamily
MVRVILFDLDDTLYPRSAGIMIEIRRLILDYIQKQFELGPEEADALRDRYLQTYGTTMRGLQVNHGIDPEEYLHHVHDIALDEYLQPNPELGAVLGALSQQKVIFTNASREHAQRVLDVLGIRRHFSRIVDVRDMEYESKPREPAYVRVCRMLGVEPEECVLVEDNVRNLCPAKEIGMVTVLVGDGRQAGHHCVDHAVERVEEIGKVLAGIEGMVPGRKG